MPKTVAVIDGNSLMHRAYHAVPPTMTAPDGTPIQCGVRVPFHALEIYRDGAARCLGLRV